MSYLHAKHGLSLTVAARTLVVATAVFGSYTQAQTPCESRPMPRPSVKSAAQKASPKVDWTTLASTYTHDANGQRVDQFAHGVEPETYAAPDFVRSGFTHTRSSLQVGFNSDHYHVTEQWGGQVRPYGEWRYPYRPFSVPYGAWGPQLPQVSVQGLGVYPWGIGPGQGHPGQGHPWHTPHPGSAATASGAGVPGSGAPAGSGAAGTGPMGAGAPGPGVPAGHPGMHPGYGYPQGAPWWGYPGVSPYPPYGGVGPYGVGPANGMSPIQEEYYPQAPMYQQPSDGYFQSPYRTVP